MGSPGPSVALVGAEPSTSGRQVGHKFISNQKFRINKGNSRHLGGSARRLITPPRVTNQGHEMRLSKGLRNGALEENGDEDDFIEVDPEIPVPRPELGPLERRVSTTFEEGLEREDIDPEAMEYWFTEPAGGWPTGKMRLRKPMVLPTEAIDDLRHPETETATRRPLGQLRPGDILQGTVIAHILHHGLQVDVGFEADGLVCFSGLDEWQRLGNVTPVIGSLIEVEVYAVRDDPIFRFPLQLMPTDPELGSRLPAPDGHIPPLDLRDVALSNYADVAARTGRTWEPTVVSVGPQYDLAQAVAITKELAEEQEEMKPEEAKKYWDGFRKYMDEFDDAMSALS